MLYLLEITKVGTTGFKIEGSSEGTNPDGLKPISTPSDQPNPKFTIYIQRVETTNNSHFIGVLSIANNIYGFCAVSERECNYKLVEYFLKTGEVTLPAVFPEDQEDQDILKSKSSISNSIPLPYQCVGFVQVYGSEPNRLHKLCHGVMFLNICKLNDGVDPNDQDKVRDEMVNLLSNPRQNNLEEISVGNGADLLIPVQIINAAVLLAISGYYDKLQGIIVDIGGSTPYHKIFGTGRTKIGISDNAEGVVEYHKLILIN